MFVIFVLFLATISAIIWYKWRKRLMSQFKRNGIPGPEPHLLFGNSIEFLTKGYVKCHEEWIGKYGRIVGYYLGGKAFLLVADPELLKLIQIKDFHLFSKRQMMIDSGMNPNPRLRHSLITCADNRWKQMRSTLTPTFSGSKLRQMTRIIDITIDKFMARVAENAKQDQEFDIYELLQGLTMDTIAKTGFGFDSGSQDSTEDQVIAAAKGTFNLNVRQRLLFLWLLFPEFRFIIDPFRRFIEQIKDYFGHSDHGLLLKISDQLIKNRRKESGKGRKDLLQLMLDSEVSEVLSEDKLSISTDMSDDTIIETRPKNPSKVRQPMTDDEIASNAVLFFDAGYETTSSALAYVIHVLINRQELQQMVRQEVEELLQMEGNLDYNTVTKLHLMEAVIYETLRLYPPITTFVARRSGTNYPYKGMTIPKGVDIRVPLLYLHKDPELWSEPEVFDPKRFAAENRHLVNPVVWQPFGVGPRNCIGMRFALLEIKLTLAKLLLRYKLIASNNTELGDICRDFKVISMTPRYGVFTKAVNIS